MIDDASTCCLCSDVVPFCCACMIAVSLVWTDYPEVSFLGLAPGEDARYDVEVTWSPGEVYGAVNLTVGCNATDSSGRPLATVTPLSFAVVREPALKYARCC